MSDEPEWLRIGGEAELRAAVKFTDPHQPGVRCADCSVGVIWYKAVYHPTGRNEHESGQTRG